MPGRVDEIDHFLPPLAGGAGRGDGDAAFLFLGHIVHGGRTVVDFAHTVNFAAVEQHTLGKSCLARVDMGDNTDITDVADWGHGWLRLGGVASVVRFFQAHGKGGRETPGAFRSPAVGRVILYLEQVNHG